MDLIDGQAALLEERDFCLRSLRDLDAEWEAGDLDAADYATLRDSYTARAAAALRALSGEDPEPGEPGAQLVLPLMGDGEMDDLGGLGGAGGAGGGAVGAGGAGGTDQPAARAARRWPRRVAIATAVALIAAGAGWAVAASSGTRLPGQEITGKALGSQAEAQLLKEASDAAGKGDVLGAVKDYQKILASNPTDPDALTGEGWVLAEVGEPSLLQQGLTLLAKAETSNPDYAPAHAYRGLALLSEDDYSGAIPELQWYLAHNPDPSAVAQVRQALQQAQAAAKTQPPAAPTTTAG